MCLLLQLGINYNFTLGAHYLSARTSFYSQQSKLKQKIPNFFLKKYYLKKKLYSAYVLPKRLHLNSHSVTMYTPRSLPHPSVQCCATIRAYCEKQQTPQLSFEQRGEGCSLFCAPKYPI